MTNEQSKLEKGTKVKVNGKTYTVEAVYEVTKALSEHGVIQSVAVKGVRGALALLQVFDNATGSLVFPFRSNKLELFNKWEVA